MATRTTSRKEAKRASLLRSGGRKRKIASAARTVMAAPTTWAARQWTWPARKPDRSGAVTMAMREAMMIAELRPMTYLQTGREGG